MNKFAVIKAREFRRKMRVKRKLKTGQDRPRLCFTKTNKHLIVQVIDDLKGHTLVCASTMEKDFPLKGKKNIDAAKELGKILASKALQKGLKKVVFDRNGNIYHGKVKAFADAAREAGLEF
jgi:large subunit ribosomal protein L18